MSNLEWCVSFQSEREGKSYRKIFLKSEKNGEKKFQFKLKKKK